MMEEYSRGLKITFLVHLVAGLFFGLIYLLIPDVWGDLIGWPVQDATIYRVVGGAILGYAASSWWAYRETAWARVEIVVKMEIVWTVLATLALLWGLLFAGAPAIGWLNAAIMAGFAVAFAVFFVRR